MYESIQLEHRRQTTTRKNVNTISIDIFQHLPYLFLGWFSPFASVGHGDRRTWRKTVELATRDTKLMSCCWWYFVTGRKRKGDRRERKQVQTLQQWAEPRLKQQLHWGILFSFRQVIDIKSPFWLLNRVIASAKLEGFNGMWYTFFTCLFSLFKS